MTRFFARARQLVPLPLVQPPVWHGSSSRRVRLRYNRTCAVTRRANMAIKAINSLSVGGLSPESTLFERAVDLRPDSVFEPGAECSSDRPGFKSYFNVNSNSYAQGRLVSQVYQSASAYVSRLASSCDGPLCDDVLADPSVSVFSYLQSPIDEDASVPLVASLVSLPTQAATCAMLDALPPRLSARYGSPQALLRPVSEQPPVPRVSPLPRGTDPSEYLKLILRMRDAGMVKFGRNPKVVNGVFVVPKGDKLRLIIDARKANALFVEPETVDLPTPDVLAKLVANPDVPLWIAKTDVDNFYHRLALPEWLQEYFALPAVDAESVGVSGGGVVYPMLLTLAMGWSHSVIVAQSLHEHQIEKSGAFPDESRVCNSNGDTRLNRTRHSVYLDDLTVFSVDKQDGARRLQVYLKHMSDVGLPQKLSKYVPFTQDPGEVLGLECTRDRLGVSPVKLEALCARTRAVLQGRACSGVALRRLLGQWTWGVLVRRPAFAVFSSVYKFCDFAGSRVVAIWSSVRKELNTIMALVPLLFASFSAGFADRVTASDASTTGFGVCAAKVDADVVAAVAAQAHSFVDGCMMPAPSVSSLAEEARWPTIVSAPVRHCEHINVLELRALLLAVRWFLSLGRPPGSVRLLSLLDSAVALFSVSKGRSSSFQLLRVLRSLSALLLAGGVFLTPMWVPSHLNPSDAPSRAW